jgi:cell division protein FtsN
MTHKRLLALGGLILLAGCTCNRLADAPAPQSAAVVPAAAAPVTPAVPLSPAPANKTIQPHTTPQTPAGVSAPRSAEPEEVTLFPQERADLKKTLPSAPKNPRRRFCAQARAGTNLSKPRRRLLLKRGADSLDGRA